MDSDPPRPDDLSELERRLSAWAPAPDGLSADAMLFAAGRAAARPGPARFVWPALAGVMTVLAVGLGASLWSERGERLFLAQRLSQQPQAPAPAPPTPSPFSPPEPLTADEPGPDSFLAAHLALQQGWDWPPANAVRPEAPGPPPPERPVLQVGHRGAFLDP